ncbi:L,D-transpeptidase [Paenibacillus sp. PK3_47]|uniref:L,D-transpeptidase n=1 Tax=Paenibacillus sp. PK3_47 TaxID=2072642 RepID=UPI00201E5161|nr:L,D-transpeptidase [Paenibacillus sp. PK3_47]UQZ36086.1 L,D-transpeptidase [Paenibacillus sp. PK3_47]
MKNSQHLKAYVQMHPDNKMAWYLLGKEYVKNGQQGKANYCFNQAGEVYEAFERSKVPADMLKEYEEGLLLNARERHKSKLRKRRIAVALMLLMLAFLPAAVAPGSGSFPAGTASSAGSGPVIDAQVELAEEILPEPVITAQQGQVRFTAQGAGEPDSSQGLASLLQKSPAPSATAILGMQRSGKWLVWNKKLPLTATLIKNGGGQTVYQSYDPRVCQCQPPEAEGLAGRAAQWQEDQEELAVLWSAMRTYKERKGSLPQSLEALAAPFPGNWLGGTTPLMKEKFARLRTAAALAVTSSPQAAAEPYPEDSAAGGGVKEGSAQAGGAAEERPFFSGPLTIIVDKQKHRLAVTSGSIILRNYKVGLGGDKTPEGIFSISDKVVNPNGRDNGEFGSRGMQLSDSNYAIHGTDEPESIGRDESLGCIRMSRKDVEELFAMVPMGTKVQITKGVLPEELLVPAERYPSGAPQNQTNPHKVYHWLN